MKPLKRETIYYINGIWGFDSGSSCDDVQMFWDCGKYEMVCKRLVDANAVENNCDEAKNIIEVAESITQEEEKDIIDQCLESYSVLECQFCNGVHFIASYCDVNDWINGSCAFCGTFGQVKKKQEKIDVYAFENRCLRQYLETMLWAEFDESNPQGGDPLDKNYCIDDISDELIEQSARDVEKFLTRIFHAGLVRESYDLEQIGHDFWLTRNRHGAGFWDGDYESVSGDGKKLTEIAQEFRDLFVIVSDDGKIYSD